MLLLNLSLVLSVILLVIGVVQMVRPFSAAPINPVLLILASLLLAARYFAVRQHQKRAEILRNMSSRPLGISDDDGV